MSSDIQTIFLHNISNHNRDVVYQNFNSFKKNGNSIVPIRDEDVEGIDGAIPIPINSHIPRSEYRWTSPDAVYINYILNNHNNLTHKYYMLCEYDCYCEANLDILFEKYKTYDVVAPRIVTFENNPDWQWFRDIKDIFPKEHLIGFMPATFILFSREAILAVAYKYKELWSHISNSNVEARLGLISKTLGLKIGSCEEFNSNIDWFKIHFKTKNLIYHPVKELIDSSMFIKKPKFNTKNYGLWEFGRKIDNKSKKICDIYLQKDGIINYSFHDNESYWGEDDSFLYFYNGRGNITTIFSIVNDNLYYADYYNGDYESNLNSKDFHWIKKII